MAHIALTAYDLENGGISRVAIYLANGFAAAGHRVSLILCTSAGERDADFKARLTAGIDYIALSDHYYASRAFGQVMQMRAFRAWLRTNRPDIVMGTANNISWFSGMGLAANRAIKARLYIKTTNPILREKDGKPITALRRWGYRKLFLKAEKTLTLSDAESRILQTQFPACAGRFRSVFNPYITDDFLHMQKPPANPSGKARVPILVAIGRLAPQKNMTRLIQAFAIAKAKDAEQGGGPMAAARLIIAGEGPELGLLQQLASDSGLPDAVEFPGFSDDIPALLRRASLFILSSNYEGLPAVVIEALGSNCPVVSTDCFPAAQELLTALPGCVVTERSAEALADGILQAVAAWDASPDNENEVLRKRALDYSLQSATDSHLRAMDL
ncbi:glycosyltransferase [Sphingorhabdus arenilitoris]|uniref:Glycosyltransferase n=1 Tax=Sphingorhabdus arenilitoris TaxID=1490041 RepID=A0ABV8RD79_9SPHN